MTIKAELTKGEVQALLEVMPKSDVRYYLNGACIDADRKLVIATDGHILIAFRVNVEGTGQAIVKRETLEQVVKAFGKAKFASFETGKEKAVNVYVNGSRIGADLVDGNFPDYGRVIPTKASGEVAQFNPELLARLNKAFAKLGAKGPVEVEHNGLDAALVAHSSVADTVAVVMPFRPNGVDAASIARTLLGSALRVAA